MSVHHYCCRILDLFSDAKYLYFVMEIEGGSTLQNYCQDRNCYLKEEHARNIAVKIAQGIGFLHEYSIIVGKLSLTSILMTDNTE